MEYRFSENYVVVTTYVLDDADNPCTGREYFEIDNCGYFQDKTIPISTVRTTGRRDYQLLYIMDGEMTFEFNGAATRLGKGNLILFKPGEIQKYYASQSTQRPHYAWIHFYGSLADEVMSSPLFNKNIFPLGDFPEFYTGCIKIQQMLKSTPLNRELVASQFLKICGLIKQKNGNDAPKGRFGEVLNKMNENGGYFVSIPHYAKMCNMSEYHFIRSFKKAFGCTPGKYKAQLVIEKSILLLTETDLKINDISERLGFDNPFYFSKLFKTVTGYYPDKYRTTYHDKNNR